MKSESEIYPSAQPPSLTDLGFPAEFGGVLQENRMPRVSETDQTADVRFMSQGAKGDLA